MDPGPVRVHLVPESTLQRRIFDLLGRWPQRLRLSLEHLPLKRGIVHWTPLPSYRRSLDDGELLEATGVLQHFPSGNLYIHTETSIHLGGCFRLAAADLERFILEHYERYGEDFFGIDPLLVSQEEPLLWTLHHEGLVGLLRGPPSPEG